MHLVIQPVWLFVFSNANFTKYKKDFPPMNLNGDTPVDFYR